MGKMTTAERNGGEAVVKPVEVGTCVVFESGGGRRELARVEAVEGKTARLLTLWGAGRREVFTAVRGAYGEVRAWYPVEELPA